MDTTHRKIELQTPSDLQHLLASASQLARQQIDLHFPPTAPSTSTDPTPSSDPMRRLVEEEVQAFLSRTFDGVKSNISVNGLEGAEMARLLGEQGGAGAGDTEAFDHRLARRVQAVSSEIEMLTLELANLRRGAPAGLAGKYLAGVDDGTRLWEEKARRGEEEELRKAGEVEVSVDGLEKVPDMRKSWEAGTRRLVEVKEGIGGVVGKGERAREGVRYLESA